MWRLFIVAGLGFSLLSGNLLPAIYSNTFGPVPAIVKASPLTESSGAETPSTQRVSEAYGKLPLSFEKNTGQIDSQVKFFSRVGGNGLYLTANEAVMVLSNTQDSKPGAREILRMKLQRANLQPHITGIDELPGKSNYLIGEDPTKWQTNVPSYTKVKYEDVYPGIDLVYYSKAQEIEYDFVVAPGANHQKIRLAFNGARSLTLDQNGDVIVKLNDGEIRQRKPFIYQEIQGRRVEIAGRYLLTGRTEVGFEVGTYDRHYALVIDPVISFSTYLGGQDEDWGRAIAVDASGNSYIAGYTFSSNFPVTRNQANLYDAFVVKLNPTGSGYVYRTFFGGSNYDYCYAIALDSAGNAYLSGKTESTNFPRVNALQNSLQGTTDGWITKLNSAGNGFVYSTYLGGNANFDTIVSMAVDSSGSAYFAGATTSTNLPVVSAFQSANGGGQDGFVGKLTAGGNALSYLSYLGGSGGDTCNEVAVDTAGNAYVAGTTGSTNLPTVNPLQAANAGGFDVLVAKVNPTGNTLIYSTYIGGSADDSGFGIAVDDSGNVYIVGQTKSANFPVRNPAQSTLGGVVDAFVTKLNADASDFAYSTFLGGSNTVNTTCGCQSESAGGIAVKDGNAYVVGTTDTTDFPQVNPVQPAYGGGSWDAFTAKYDAFGSVIYATYFGGGGPQNTEADGSEQGFGIAVDANGNSYLTGITGSLEFPTVNALQATYGGGGIAHTDAFAAKILDIPGFVISGQILDAGNNPIAGVTVSLTGSRTLTAQTNATGNYSFSGLGSGYNCTVTPSKNLYTFAPASQTFNNLSASQTANFTGTGLNTYTISGRVSKSDGSGVAGVTISLTGSQSRTQSTDSAGNYAFSLLVQGESFTVTPSLPPTYTVTNTFTPALYNFNAIAGNQTANFNLAVTTTVSMFPVADAYVEDGANAANNFGTVTPLLLKTANTTGQRRDVYLKYDLSTVTRKITSAKLRMFAALSVAGSVSTSGYAVTDTVWTENTINWNNKPVRNSTAISGATAAVTSTAFATYELDLTAYIIAEQSAGRDVVSLALHNPSNSTPHILLNAREADSNKPQLVLTTLDSNNSAPTVNLSSPANNASFNAPATVPLSASASDSDGTIAKVEYYSGTTSIGSATVSPFNVSWPSVPTGNYTLRAVATDNSGLSTLSSPIQITVGNANIPPVMSITAPLTNTNFPAGANITINADASDVDGNITQVEFFNGAASLGADNTAPYTFTWNNVPAGAYSLTARATDNSGGVTSSAAVTVKVVSQTGLSPVADAYVRDGSSAATNFGSATELQVQQGAAGSNRESFLRFDLTSITGLTSIVRARLRVFGRLSDTSGTNVGVGVYSVTNTTWGETSITWNTKQTANTPVLATTTVTDNVSRWYEFDVSGYVQSEKAAGRNLVSLVLKSESASTPFATFNSRDNTNQRPQLVLWTTAPRNALFAVGSSNLTTADNAIKSRLESLGFTVTVEVANNGLITADADGKAVVVISSTVNASNVTTKFRYVAVPVVTWEYDILGHMLMTAATGSFGTTATTQNTLNVTNANHPLAAGLSGPVQVATTATTFGYGVPPAGAIVIASIDGDPGKSAIFAYDRDATMFTLDAPARRVSLFLTDTTAAGLNPFGNSLFDAAIKWATEVKTAPTIESVTPASGPAGTSITISGFNFGATQGTSSLSLNGLALTPVTWTDKVITACVPNFATTGPILVTVNGVAGNVVTFTVGLVDSDGDGLPDAWELQYFGNLNQTANSDPDGDGLTNIQEYQQGRNPTVNATTNNGAIELKIFTPLASPMP